MQVNMRQERRRTGRQLYSLCWESGDGMTRNADVRGIDLSRSGIRVSSPLPIPAETVVFLRAHNGDTLNGSAVVRHCLPHGDAYAIGMAFQEETKASVTFPEDSDINYYTFLQVSPKADWPSIHRIYRIMASRFHPDNPETGDPDKFLILQKALETLSDPERRRAYDASLQSADAGGQHKAGGQKDWETHHPRCRNKQKSPGNHDEERDHHGPLVAYFFNQLG